MSSKKYSLYKFTWTIKHKIRAKLSPAGRFAVVFILLAGFFGLDTQKSMIYQLFAISLSMFAMSVVCSRKLKSQLTVKRILPETCSVGDKLIYTLQLSNIANKPARGLFFKEILNNPVPDYIEFANTPEDGEDKRNWFDRRAKYYRWLWIISNNTRAQVLPQFLPNIDTREDIEVHVSLLPTRRGYLHLTGYSIYRFDPFGLIKTGRAFDCSNNILVLPKIYPIENFPFIGSRKYQQGGIAQALNSGDSTEFLALREYSPGDPVKRIDWKSSARIGTTVVREYHDEYYCRYGLVLDTFTSKHHSRVFEEAVSVAASILMATAIGDTILDLLFVGEQQIISTTGHGIADQKHVLGILASVPTCRDKSFAALSDLLRQHLSLLSGLAIVLIELDSERIKLLKYLTSVEISFTAMLVVESKEHAQGKITAAGLEGQIVVLEIGNIARGLSQL